MFRFFFFLLLCPQTWFLCLLRVVLESACPSPRFPSSIHQATTASHSAQKFLLAFACSFFALLCLNTFVLGQLELLPPARAMEEAASSAALHSGVDSMERASDADSEACAAPSAPHCRAALTTLRKVCRFFRDRTPLLMSALLMKLLHATSFADGGASLRRTLPFPFALSSLPLQASLRGR